jgi:hypothetical protein
LFVGVSHFYFIVLIKLTLLLSLVVIVVPMIGSVLSATSLACIAPDIASCALYLRLDGLSLVLDAFDLLLDTLAILG